MSDATILELGQEPDEARATRWNPPVRWIAGGAFAVAVLAGTAQFVVGSGGGQILELFGFARPAEAAVSVRVTRQQQRQLADYTVDDARQIVVAGKLAEERNAAIPTAGLPLEKVRAFLIAGGEAAPIARTALTCLTQAVYYEAAHEPMTGRRAVAQVVLNRMRHPAYPKSVCGVVYQGAQRRTGCQFSFTCDGSLLRTPGVAAWRAAQEVAQAALAGYVEPTVGTATHYHANYVLPKWAFNLAKIQQIGAHIFYRFPGGWGTARAFTGAYSGNEFIPTLDYTALRLRQAGETVAGVSPVSGEILTDGLSVPPHVTDRHDPRDVGGRINVTKLWRMTIKSPSESASGYRSMLDAQGAPADDVEVKPLPTSNSAASAVPEE